MAMGRPHGPNLAIMANRQVLGGERERGEFCKMMRKKVCWTKEEGGDDTSHRPLENCFWNSEAIEMRTKMR